MNYKGNYAIKPKHAFSVDEDELTIAIYQIIDSDKPAAIDNVYNPEDTENTVYSYSGDVDAVPLVKAYHYLTRNGFDYGGAYLECESEDDLFNGQRFLESLGFVEVDDSTWYDNMSHDDFPSIPEKFFLN